VEPEPLINWPLARAGEFGENRRCMQTLRIPSHPRSDGRLPVESVIPDFWTEQLRTSRA
jgi:hypothetical protein